MSILSEIKTIDDYRTIGIHVDNFQRQIAAATKTINDLRAFKTVYSGDAVEIENLIQQGKVLVENLLTLIG